MRYIQVCKALYDYDARTEEELSIREDDILYIIEKEDDDWWRAELKQQNGEEQGPVGLVPADYVEEVTPIGRVRAEFDYAAQQEEELSFEEGDEMDLLEKDDPDWYLVRLNDGQIGLAPSNYVQDADEHFEEAQEHPPSLQQDPISTPPPVATQAAPSPPAPPAPPQVQPILPHTTGSTTATREVIADDAQSWNVHEYDAAKKKKKKGKGSLFVGNGMICYGSETDKALPVQQYPILDVTKYLYDGKNLHIEIEGAKQAVLDLQASSKSEAKAILVKISDSARAAQMSNTHLNIQSQKQIAAPAAAIPPATVSYTPSPPPQHNEPEAEEEESNCVPKWGISIYSFQAEGGDELSVEENEQIYVLDYERTDGWWRVQKVDGDVGLVPSSYVQFDDQEEVQQAGIAATATSAAAAAVAGSHRNDNVEELRRKRAEEERALQQQRVAEDRAREVQRRKEQEEQEQKRREQEEARRREEEDRRREEDRQRQEEERERRRQAQEASKRAEAARQKQLEEDYRRKEAERKASLARSASKNRHQDLPKPDPAKIRTWTDRSGSFKVEAQFIDFHNGKLRLHKLNGVKIDVPVEKMCAEDVRWVEDHTRNKERDEEITPAMPPRPQQSVPAPNSVSTPSKPPQKKLNERWDWFDWFMIIGIPMQQSLQYAASFKSEKLDDSDIPNLTHKQMKILGLKEEHVQRVERYIETGQPEDSTEEEAAQKKKELSQMEKDEELARKLQREWEASEGAKGKGSSSNGRPRPTVSAPKDVHPDLLDFIGSQLSSSSADASKSKEPEKLKGDLVGFNDDAWAPRGESSPIAALSPMKTAQTTPPAAAPAGPTPEQIQAKEAERKRLQEEEQIQKIQLMSLQQQAKEQKKQLEELQKLTQQQLELQKQLAMQTGTQQQQQQQQQQMLQVQAQQQQLQHQLAQYPAQLQTFASQPTGFNIQQPTGFQTGFTTGQQSLPNGRQRPTPANSLPLDPSLGQWQPNQQQNQQHTAFQSRGNQQPMQSGFPQQQTPQQQSSWQALQPQMTGFPPSNPPVGGSNYPALAPSSAAAGQQGLSRSQTIGFQPTGRHWDSATPDNPFGSPTFSPLQPQTTGVQFSTPSPQAFHQSPLQLQQQTGFIQPQMTVFSPQQQQQQQQQPVGNSIFTPQGSMQFCSICLDDMLKDESVVSLPCGHLFGERCIKEYMNGCSTHKCPLCQASFRAGKLQRVYVPLEENAGCYKEQYDELSEKTVTLTKHCFMMARLSKMLVHNAAIVEEANAAIEEIVQDINEIMEIEDGTTEPNPIGTQVTQPAANQSTESKVDKQAPAASKLGRIPKTFRQLFKMTK
ncbi:hypothetical protein [Parasitella parasitica]|uniref:Actin cytoskeleton-regulatory complex protein SLA1 n=1 Tax=Parasitella parasitica TaxID=35722 RepID=A0A0B7NP38_9FUNG|nr:hypothetical protein [Parasitella parasitica]